MKNGECLTINFLRSLCLSNGLTTTFNQKTSKYFLNDKILNYFFIIHDSNNDFKIDYEEYILFILL